MIEKELNAAEKQYNDAAESYQGIQAVREQTKANLESARGALQVTMKESACIRAAVLLGNAPQTKLDVLRDKIHTLRQDLDELPSVLDVLDEELKNAYRELTRFQKELDHLRATKEYPIRLAEFVQAGLDDQRTLGRLNTLAAQIGKGEEVRRLAAEIRAHSIGPQYKEPFKFTADT